MGQSGRQTTGLVVPELTTAFLLSLFRIPEGGV
jgi:hypothetical protein